MIRGYLFIIFMLAASWQDARKKAVGIWLFWLFGMLSVLLFIGEGVYGEGEKMLSYLLGIVPGLLLLAANRFTRGGIGIGDGLFFLVCGLLIGLGQTVAILCTGIMICGGYGICVFVYKKIKYGINAGKETMPFLPFAAAGAILVDVVMRAGMRH